MFLKTYQLYKDSYSNHPKEIWQLIVLTFINRVGTMVLPFLTVYLTTVLNFSLKDAGILASAFGFGSMGGTYLGGKLTDKLSSQFVIINSLIFSGFLLISIQFVNTFYALFFLILATSFFGEAYRPAMMAAVGNFVPSSKTGRTMAFLRIAINLGFSGAVVIGGFIAASLGYNWLFWIDGITCIVAAVYFYSVSRNWDNYVKPEEEYKEIKLNNKILSPYKNIKYLLFLTATFCMGFSFIQWFHSVPVFIKSEWGFDERYIGILMAMNGILIVLIEMPLIHSIESSKKINLSMILGLSLVGLSFLPFLLPKALILCFLAMLLLTIGEILFMPLNSSVALNLSPANKRGSYMGFYSMMWSLTHIAGPAVGLGIVGLFGFPALWIFILFIIVASVLINIKLKNDFDQ